jgi:hypothetical protein
MDTAISDPEDIHLVSDRASSPIPVISEEAGVLTLHFESDYVQSQMLVDVDSVGGQIKGELAARGGPDRGR